jgi:hypothetical protein
MALPGRRGGQVRGFIEYALIPAFQRKDQYQRELLAITSDAKDTKEAIKVSRKDFRSLKEDYGMHFAVTKMGSAFK